MTWFLLQPDQEDESAEIDAAHPWGLPGIACDGCHQTWSTVGISYPTIDLNGWAHEAEYREARPEPLSEFRRLRDQAREVVPRDMPIGPGTQFGALVGSIADTGHPGFVWQSPWTLLMTCSTVAKLEEAGQSLPKLATPQLDGRAGADLREVEIPVVGRLSISAPTCSTCGREAVRWPSQPTLLADTLVPTLPIFRLENFPTMIVGSERFVEVVLSEAMSGLTCTPVPAV